MKKSFIFGVLVLSFSAIFLIGCGEATHEDGAEHTSWERCEVAEDCHGGEVCDDGYCELPSEHLEHDDEVTQ